MAVQQVKPEKRAKATGKGTTFSEVLAVSQRYFANVGYDGTSMREIASEVGIQPATLYSHFRSKEDILWILVSTAIEKLHAWQDEVADASHSPKEALWHFAACHARFHALNHDQALLAARRSQSLDSARFADLRKLRKAYEQRLEAILQAGAETGVFAIDEIHVSTFAILQMGTGISTWYQPGGALAAEDIALSHARLALRMVGAESSASPE